MHVPGLFDRQVRERMLPVDKLEAVKVRFSELEEELCQPELFSDQQRYTALTRERAELQPIVETFNAYLECERQLIDDKEALDDPDLHDLAAAEIPELEANLATLEEKLTTLLLPTDPNDKKNTLVEIRAGTGGDEAALFANDLFRMYTRYADGQHWKIEILSTSEASSGGYKEVVALVKGERVYSRMRFEGGVHRVQRVPATETQGRVHTSTATVAILPEAEEVDIEIREEDLEINIAASGGPGGQGVNTTNSAVQIQHKPSGLIVKCQDERSQIKNRARAMKVLRSRLLEREEAAHNASVASERRGMVGSGARAEKIRTYNYPQNRVTDHRIGLTLHKLDLIMAGELEELISALHSHEQAERLAQEEGVVA